MQRTIVEESPQPVAVMDVFSKLVQERIIYIDGVIDDDLANGVIAQMLYLSSQHASDNTIHVYINSPGGSVTSGLAIFDIAKLIKVPIRTICVGQAASMGSILMLMGQERVGLKHSRFLLHQVSGGSIGKLEDIRIDYEEMKVLENYLYDIIAEYTSFENLPDYLKFDRWFGSDLALEKGLITKIL